MFLFGEDARELLFDPGLELARVWPDLLESLLFFSFLPDPIRFFLEVESGVLVEFDLEFCLLTFPGRDCECFGEIFFRVNLERGLN